jgi:hypothetical protein
MSADIRDLTVMFYAQGSTFWHYRTATGAFSDVCADGYFDKMSDMMSSGDFILLSASDGAVQAHVHKSGGAVRLSVMCRTEAETPPKPDTSDPHQALKDAVVEAAKGYMKEGADVALYWELRKAVDAFTAAQTPPKPDPVELFFEVTNRQSMCSAYSWKYCKERQDVCYCRNNIARGLAAVEAARGAK